MELEPICGTTRHTHHTRKRNVTRVRTCTRIHPYRRCCTAAARSMDAPVSRAAGALVATANYNGGSSAAGNSQV